MADKEKQAIVEVLGWLELILLAIDPLQKIIAQLKSGDEPTDAELLVSKEARLAAYRKMMDMP